MLLNTKHLRCCGNFHKKKKMIVHVYTVVSRQIKLVRVRKVFKAN